MKEERNRPSQLSKERPEKVEEDDDSFYARDDVNDQKEDKRSSEPHRSKHKEPLPKTKGITKKKERITKQSKKLCN